MQPTHDGPIDQAFQTPKADIRLGWGGQLAPAEARPPPYVRQPSTREGVQARGVRGREEGENSPPHTPLTQ